MKNLFRKTYQLELEIPRKFIKNKKIVFKYKQGTINELLQMKNWIGSDYDVNGYLFYFLNNICFTGKITKRHFKKIKIDHMTKILDFIYKTFGKGYFVKSDQEPTSPTSSLIAFVCSNTGMSIQDVLSCTWEQIEYFTEGLIWNVNEQSKKGKAANRRKFLQHRLQNPDVKMASDLEELRKLDERIKAKQINKLK